MRLSHSLTDAWPAVSGDLGALKSLSFQILKKKNLCLLSKAHGIFFFIIQRQFLKCCPFLLESYKLLIKYL